MEDKEKVVAKVEEFEKKAEEKEKQEKEQKDETASKVEKAKEEKDSSIEISSIDDMTKKKDMEASRAEILAKNKKQRKIKKIKKIVKIVAIILVAIIGITIFAKYQSYKVVMAALSEDNKTQTGVVEKMDISDTISTTGTVQSKDVRTVTSALSGVTISKVNYEIGDMVNEGDVIVEFSREDIQDSIDQAAEDLAEAQKSKAAADSYKSEDHNYDYASATYATASSVNSTAQSAESLAQAQAALSRAQDDKNAYVDKYNTAVNNVGAVQAEYDQASAYYDLFKATHTQQTLVPGTFPETGDNSAQAVINFLGYEYTEDEFNNYISDLNSQLTKYKNTISSYDTTTYDKSITSAQESLKKAQLSYEAALIQQGDKATSQEKSLNTSDYNYEAYLITAGDSVTKAERTLKSQQDKLDDYIVYAPISGLVTSVSAQEGNGYVNTSGGLMTIQAVDSYEITTQIDEYDINNVTVGQRVVIMTDATGDDELEGQVSFVSPTATTSSSSSGQTSSSSGNTYEVKIDILSDDARIKLGMSAKLNIIMKTDTGVLCVPYDAIEENEDGTEHYVMVVSGIGGGSNSTSDAGGIVVEGVDGTPTGAPSGLPSGGMEPGNIPGKSSANMSFVQYLFASKKAQEAANDTGLSSAAKKVDVIIGIEDDYYTEITSSELREGDVVILNTGSDKTRDMYEMMMGGGPGGGGPGM